MENKLTPELIEKAKLAKSAEELIALAKENGTQLTAEEANTYFAKLNPKMGELNDDELDSVAGGCDDEPEREYRRGYPVIKSPTTYSCQFYNEKVSGQGAFCTSCYYYDDSFDKPVCRCQLGFTC